MHWLWGWELWATESADTIALPNEMSKQGRSCLLSSSLISCSPERAPEAYVSLVTNDTYSLGALTLGRSLRDAMTTRSLSLLITNGVSHQMRLIYASVCTVRIL